MVLDGLNMHAWKLLYLRDTTWISMYALASVRVCIVLLYACEYTVLKKPEYNHVCVTALTFN